MTGISMRVQLKRWVGGRYWRGILGVIGSGLVFVGLFGPWLWHGHDGTRTFNINTQEYEIHYNTIFEISPLCARLIEDGVSKASFWFYEFNLSLTISSAAIGFIVGAVLCLISFGRWRVSLTGFFFYVISFVLFWSSFNIYLGMFLGWDLRMFLGWGVWVTLVGGFVIFTSVIINYLSR